MGSPFRHLVIDGEGPCLNISRFSSVQDPLHLGKSDSSSEGQCTNYIWMPKAGKLESICWHLHQQFFVCRTRQDPNPTNRLGASLPAFQLAQLLGGCIGPAEPMEAHKCKAHRALPSMWRPWPAGLPHAARRAPDARPSSERADIPVLYPQEYAGLCKCHFGKLGIILELQIVQSQLRVGPICLSNSARYRCFDFGNRKTVPRHEQVLKKPKRAVLAPLAPVELHS